MYDSNTGLNQENQPKGKHVRETNQNRQSMRQTTMKVDSETIDNNEKNLNEENIPKTKHGGAGDSSNGGNSEKWEQW